MVITTISEAKAQLSKLIAKVEAGQEVIIGRAGKPVAKIVPIGAGKAEWKPGALKGKIKMAPDFDKLPDDIARSLGMID
jgi:prevent-host-death family protein